MSVTITCPSEYFKQTMSAKDIISEDFTPDFTPNKQGVNPLHNLIFNENVEEIKRLISHKTRKDFKEMVLEAMGDDAAILRKVDSAIIFKILHDAWYKTRQSYTFEMFESAFGIVTGAAMMCYIATVKKHHSDDEIKECLSGLSFYKFGYNLIWSPKTLIPTDKGFSAGNVYLKVASTFLKDYLGPYAKNKSKYQFKNESGNTILHELVKSDKHLGKLIFLVEFFKLKVTDFINEDGDTVLKTAFMSGAKKNAEWLMMHLDNAINDQYGNDGMNSACALVTNFASFTARGNEYAKHIDESSLDDVELSVLNHMVSDKFDASLITPMRDELLEKKVGGRPVKYGQLLVNEVSPKKTATKASPKTATKTSPKK